MQSTDAQSQSTHSHHVTKQVWALLTPQSYSATEPQSLGYHAVMLAASPRKLMVHWVMMDIA